MKIGHSDAFSGKLVYMRRFNDGIAVTAQVAKAKVVGEKDNDIGLVTFWRFSNFFGVVLTTQQKTNKYNGCNFVQLISLHSV